MNKNKVRAGSRVFEICNYFFLGFLAISCVIPLIHELALSLSSGGAASAGKVFLIPVEFSLDSYAFILRNNKFLHALLISVVRVILGVTMNLALIVITAYPLSRESHEFKARTFYSWFLFVTILFSGGMVPTYMVVQSYGLLDSIWALILPGAVPVFSVVLMLNFFRQLPKAVEEAAFIDGAGYFRTLWKIYLPMSLPAVATVSLFAAVAHWNSWFDGIIYMNQPSNYPLQSYLQVMIMMASNSQELLKSTPEMADMLKKVGDSTLKAAQIFLGSLPIIAVYPFLQRYFMKGIVVGSVKE